MKKIFFIIILSFVNMLLLYSQNNKYLSPVIPPSPTSAIFNRYGDHQPSLSSGTINIPISLFEIKTDNFTLPFTLRYSTSGINISDRPYPAGYGWIFSSGLRVTRTVLGRPDDQFSFREMSSNDSFETIKRGIIDPQNNSAYGIADNELYDTQKDIFTAHLPSGSYTFLINKTQNTYEAISIGNLLKFEFFLLPNTSLINGFKITDENGIVYIFGMYANESSLFNYVEWINPTGNTAWMLREIILPNNAKINFTWKKFSQGNKYSPRVTTSVGITDAKAAINCNTIDPLPEYSDVGGIIEYNNYTELCMLEKVEFPSGTMNVLYRSDNDPFISNINVKNKNGVSCRNIDFAYGTGDYQEEALLKSIKIDQEIYKFTYNSNRFYKDATGLDYWGYYNGKNNQDLIPKMTLNLYSSYVDYVLYPNYSMTVGSANRSVDVNFMKAFMLTRIDYPTGGYSEFEYETHQFTNKFPASTNTFISTPESINKGGGLRVSKITTKESATSNTTVKTYKYGTVENGLANIVFAPTLDTFIDELCIVVSHPCLSQGVEPWAYRQLNINAMSNYSKYLIQGIPIWYNMVTEYTNDYKTEYYYDYDGYNEGYTSPVKWIKKAYIYTNGAAFEDGPRLKEQITYKKEGQAYSPLEKRVYSYELQQMNLIKNYIIDRRVINSFNPHGNGCDFVLTEPSVDRAMQMSGAVIGSSNNTNIYDVIPYNINRQYYRLKGKQVTSMIGTSNINTTEEYAYYDQSKQMKNITKNTSDPTKKISTEYKYPRDYTDAIYVTMKNKNMQAPVIEEITYNGASERQRIKTNYTNATSITNGLIRPASIQTSSSGMGNLQTEVNFDRYDAQGNLLQATLKDGTTQSYLWSYSYQYPIADIKNASYNDISTALTALGINTTTLASNPNPDDVTFNKLKELGTRLPNAFVSIYKYRPLIGMLETINPQLLTTFYSYDDYGRLTFIKDNENKLISTYEYNYKGPGEPMQISVPVAASYMVTSSYLTQMFTATVTNNIGSLSYSWYLKNSSGITIASTLNQTSNSYTATLQTPGATSITCIAKDNFTQKTVEISKSFDVNVATEFRNIIKTGDSESNNRSAKADIYMSNAGTIRFEVNCQKMDSRVYIKLGNSTVFEITDYNSNFTRDIYCYKGWTNASITIEGYDPSAVVDIRIISVDGGNTIGSNDWLYLWP